MLRSVIYGTIFWVVVPGIMLAMLTFSIIVAALSPEQVSAWSGFSLGLLIFVIYVVNRMPVVTKNETPVDEFSGYIPTTRHQFDFSRRSWIIQLIAGGVVGFSLLWLVVILKPTKSIGIVTLFLSAVSTCSFFSYFFIESIQETTMFFSLGIPCGVLIYMMFFPVSSIFS